jgi:tubulin-specific chaperone D
MDVTDEEQDIKLQRQAADLLADLDRSLPGYVRKIDSTGRPVLRSRVRVHETFRIAAQVCGTNMRCLSLPSSPP